MKFFFLLLFMLLAVNTFAQSGGQNIIKLTDTKKTSDSVKVVYEKNYKSIQTTATPVWYIDSIAVGTNRLIFDTKDIESVVIDNQRNGSIYLTSKKTHLFNFIALDKLINKYIKQAELVNLVMVDNEIVKSGLSHCKIDEKYIQSVSVVKSDDVECLKELKDKFTIISVFTRSEQNLKKTEIRIRGNSSILVDN